jgi:hypothetical protein
MHFLLEQSKNQNSFTAEGAENAEVRKGGRE